MPISSQDSVSFNKLENKLHPSVFVNYIEPRQLMIKWFIEQKMIEYMINALQNWSDADVRTVPKVMYQLRCKSKDADVDVEFRFHLFMNCEETYVHNHQYEFYSYCLQGEYEEKLWELDEDHKDSITYQFPRISGNGICSPERVQGALVIQDCRHHFAGNVLHVDTHQYHSIACTSDDVHGVVTFVARIICPTAIRTTYIWSEEEIIRAPINEIRLATDDERKFVHHKLQQIFRRLLCSNKFR